MEENELIQRLRRSEEDAFEIIFRKHFAGLSLFAEHYVRNDKVAEEIVEDFFCHLWDNCQSLSINSSLKGYLFQSIHNRCLNYIRNQKVRQQYLTDNQYFFADDELLESASPDSPNTVFIARELEDSITFAINALPEQCRAIFCLNRFENLTYLEIAEKLNISINTVKTQMARALYKLRGGLKDFLVMLLVTFFIFSKLPF